MNEDMWTMKDGSKIKVSDMSTSHIKNALTMLKRKGFIGSDTLGFYLTCEPPSGDMAQYAFEQEFDRVLDAPVSEFVDIFVQELKRRKEVACTEGQ